MPPGAKEFDTKEEAEEAEKIHENHRPHSPGHNHGRHGGFMPPMNHMAPPSMGEEHEEPKQN